MKTNNLIKFLQMLVVCVPVAMVHRGAFARSFSTDDYNNCKYDIFVNALITAQPNTNDPDNVKAYHVCMEKTATTRERMLYPLKQDVYQKLKEFTCNGDGDDTSDRAKFLKTRKEMFEAELKTLQDSGIPKRSEVHFGVLSGKVSKNDSIWYHDFSKRIDEINADSPECYLKRLYYQMQVAQIEYDIKFYRLLAAQHKEALVKLNTYPIESETVDFIQYDTFAQNAIAYRHVVSDCTSYGDVIEQTERLNRCNDKWSMLVLFPVCFPNDIGYLEAYYTCLQAFEKNKTTTKSPYKVQEINCDSDTVDEYLQTYKDAIDNAIDELNQLINKMKTSDKSKDLRFSFNKDFGADHYVSVNRNKLLNDSKNCALVKTYDKYSELYHKYQQSLSLYTQEHCGVQLEKIKKHLADNGGNADQTTTVVEDPKTKPSHPKNEEIYIHPAILTDMLESGMYVDNPNLFVMHIRALLPDVFNKKQVITMKNLGQACLNYGMSKTDCEKFIRAYIDEFNKGKK